MVVDASVWVSGLVAQDVHHQTSRRWLARTIDGGETLVIPTLALAEVGGAIARRTGLVALGQQAVETVLQSPGLQLVPLDVDLGTEAARIAATGQLRGADAVYVVVAQALHAPLVTLDTELFQRAGLFVRVIHP